MIKKALLLTLLVFCLLAASSALAQTVYLNNMDFSKFLDKMAVAAETAKNQIDITKMMPLISNQARYSFAHFSVDTSKRKVDMYQYHTQVAGRIVIISCLAYDDTIDEEKAFFDQVIDSIWCFRF